MNGNSEPTSDPVGSGPCGIFAGPIDKDDAELVVAGEIGKLRAVVVHCKNCRRVDIALSNKLVSSRAGSLVPGLALGFQ
jgi:hypothetical protein